MALLTEGLVRQRASDLIKLTKSTPGKILKEAAGAETFDVFLSHSSNEPEEILLGIKGFLEDDGLNVYVDKYTDPQLSAEEVTSETAAILRDRLGSSRSLLYIHSRHSKSSSWMPWELGFMDAATGRVGIVPVMQTANGIFHGAEYLGLYPYLDRATIAQSSKWALWINRTSSEYAKLTRWVEGKEQIRKHA